jgi:Common central domain of tyrosinase/Polyphenol oxidase middle domain
MKKIATIALTLFFSYAAISLGKKEIIRHQEIKRVYNVCRPVNVRIINPPPNSATFSSLPSSTPSMPRYDLFSPNGKMALDKLNLGIDMMKNLSPSDPLSWDYQTSIHGILGTLNSTMAQEWNSGKDYAHNNTEFFLHWHRMYLYFFERIVAQATGDISFRIPYWNPAANINLPAAFQSNTALGGITNHLYIASPDRSKVGLTAKEQKQFKSAVKKALSATSYCIFLEKIESLHQFIHGAIGGFANSSSTGLGYMTTMEISPKDPIFFVFHSYIDRLWEKWLRLKNRKNASGNFLSQEFYFHDVTSNGQSNLIKITGNQVLNTSSDLKYTYQGVSGLASTNLQAACCPITSNRTVLLRNSNDIAINQNKTSLPLTNTTIALSLSDFALLRKLKSNQRLYAEFDNIVINQMPKDLIGIYLVKRGKQNLPPQPISFVGIVDVLNARMNHVDENGKIKLRINITDVVKNIRIPLARLQQTSLIFKVINDEGLTTNLAGNVTLKGLTIVLEEN